jgi:8-oxo-dGTP pyrophosphatase MutT (NUDIX family)
VRAEPTILFTRRTPNLSRHAGQVSFPGGRVHESDLSLVETALRETQEETGITAGFVSVAGFLDSYETGTGFAILPVVGLLTEGFELLPDPNEVEEVFEVPLAFLLDPANRQRHSMEWQGRRREFYAFAYGSHDIWGATAGILVNFADRLQVE